MSKIENLVRRIATGIGGPIALERSLPLGICLVWNYEIQGGATSVFFCSIGPFFEGVAETRPLSPTEYDWAKATIIFTVHS